ncbi:MAG: class I SAM-dependent methyltransferase [Dehalococcoidia bacterium]
MGDALERLRPYADRARDFSGWQFPGLVVDHFEGGPPWDYGAIVREHAVGRASALDMGTGGGEVLSRMRGALPERVVAIEEWHVNAPVARDLLAPLGVAVVRARSIELPFHDAAFDLVLNRHEELDPGEVARVLAPGGALITQQVGRSNWQELRTHFPRMTDFGDQRAAYASGLANAGLIVTTNVEHEFHTAFGSLGDIVYMLSVTPWSVSDFDVERDLEALLALEEACRTERGLVLTEGRYLLVAENPV